MLPNLAGLGIIPPYFSRSTPGRKMPLLLRARRWLSLRAGSSGALGVLWALLAATLASGQVPANPLRGGSLARPIAVGRASQAVQNAAWIWEEDAAADPLPISTQENLPPPSPPSVVPQQFGEAPADTEIYDQWAEQGYPGADPYAVGDYSGEHWFTHTDPNDPYRHIGLGQPLVGTSWRNRPWFVGAFVGGMLSDDLISGRAEQNNSSFLGTRLGWDFEHYWGLELRYAYARTNLTDGQGDRLDEPSRDYFVDLSLVHYPWGDSQWRPYLSAGLGFDTFRFEDDADQRVHQTLLAMPLGGGLKYYYNPWFTIRFDACDNIAFGDEPLDTMHNFSLMIGAEYRFGGTRMSYFPWHGNTMYW